MLTVSVYVMLSYLQWHHNQSDPTYLLSPDHRFIFSIYTSSLSWNYPSLVSSHLHGFHFSGVSSLILFSKPVISFRLPYLRPLYFSISVVSSTSLVASHLQCLHISLVFPPSSTGSLISPNSLAFPETLVANECLANFYNRP